jgi:hypothetical protein
MNMVIYTVETADLERRIKEIRMSPPIPEWGGYAIWKQIMISVLTDMLKRCTK